MPDLLVRSFAPFLLAFQPCFTRPSFASFWALTCAWILCSGRRSLTRIIQSAQLTQFKHFCSFHRFFSQARWNLDDLGRCVFQLLLPFCAETLVAAERSINLGAGFSRDWCEIGAATGFSFGGVATSA